MNSILLRSFDACFQADGTRTKGQRQFCTTDDSGGWAAFDQLYVDSNCETKSQSKQPGQVASGPLCDAKGNEVRCQVDLSALNMSYPRALVESVYSDLTCGELNIYQRIITPPNGCTVISTESTDTYLRVSSCEVLPSGMVAFGTLHSDDKCVSSPAIPTAHVLPKGCLAIPGGIFSVSFTCG